MTGHRQIFLHFVKPCRIDLRQRVLLCVHHAGLQRNKDFGECERAGIGPIGLEHLHAPGAAGNAQLQTLQVAGHLDRVLVIGDLTKAILPDADDVIPGLFGGRNKSRVHDLVADFRHVGAVLDQIGHFEYAEGTDLR